MMERAREILIGALCTVLLSLIAGSWTGCALPGESVSLENRHCADGTPSLAWYFSVDETEQTDLVTQYRSSLEPVFEKTSRRLEKLFPEKEIEVVGRLKSVTSIQEKLVRKRSTYRCLGDVVDVVGLRIIVPTWGTLPIVNHRLRSNFEISKIDDQRHIDDPSMPYRAVHYDVIIKGRPAELQVHTRRSALVAGATHRWIYKGPYRNRRDLERYMAKIGYATLQLDCGLPAAIPAAPPGLPVPVTQGMKRLIGALGAAEDTLVPPARPVVSVWE